jgi:hypothetical protein
MRRKKPNIDKIKIERTVLEDLQAWVRSLKAALLAILKKRAKQKKKK